MSAALSPRDRITFVNTLSDIAEFATVRGRQAIVRNAIAGYPFSEQVNHALRLVKRESPQFVFADDLIGKLAGNEPLPGVPALALIAPEPGSRGCCAATLGSAIKATTRGLPRPPPSEQPQRRLRFSGGVLVPA